MGEPFGSVVSERQRSDRPDSYSYRCHMELIPAHQTRTCVHCFKPVLGTQYIKHLVAVDNNVRNKLSMLARIHRVDQGEKFEKESSKKFVR